MIDVHFVALDGALDAPGYARPGDAGADLVARVGIEIAPAGGRARVATGLALQLPEGFAGLVLPRSGLAARHGVTCLNAPGLIDPGYRGEIEVLLVNTDPSEAYRVERGDRIAQLLIVAFEAATFTKVSTLDESARASGGFGHTGR